MHLSVPHLPIFVINFKSQLVSKRKTPTKNHNKYYFVLKLLSILWQSEARFQTSAHAARKQLFMCETVSCDRASGETTFGTALGEEVPMSTHNSCFIQLTQSLSKNHLSIVTGGVGDSWLYQNMVKYWSTLCKLRNFSRFICCLFTFIKKKKEIKIFQKHYQSVKRFGSRSGRMLQIDWEMNIIIWHRVWEWNNAMQ